jgi:hypothetical protein
MRTLNVFAVMGLFASGAVAGTVTPGIPEGDFAGATIEKFQEAEIWTTSYAWASGLRYNSLTGNDNICNYTNGYGMGNAPFISAGKDNDGYFGTGPSPETFEFILPVPSILVGWYGAESDVGEPGGRDANWNMSFFDSANNLIATIDDATPINVHAWDQFHGYRASDPVARIVFNNAGHMVVDDIRWMIPTPSAAAILGLGALAAARRRR